MVNKDLHNGPLVCGFNVAVKGLILYIDQNSDVAHCISSVYKEKPNYIRQTTCESLECFSGSDVISCYSVCWLIVRPHLPVECRQVPGQVRRRWRLFRNPVVSAPAAQSDNTRAGAAHANCLGPRDGGWSLAACPAAGVVANGVLCADRM